MEDIKDKLILDSITQHRAALALLRKSQPITKKDIEILAFAQIVGLFNFYQPRQFYVHMNIQQLRTSVKNMEKAGYINLVKADYKNKPAYFMKSFKGVELISKYTQIIRYN